MYLTKVELYMVKSNIKIIQGGIIHGGIKMEPDIYVTLENFEDLSQTL